MVITIECIIDVKPLAPIFEVSDHPWYMDFIKWVYRYLVSPSSAVNPKLQSRTKNYSAVSFKKRSFGIRTGDISFRETSHRLEFNKQIISTFLIRYTVYTRSKHSPTSWYSYLDTLRIIKFVKLSWNDQATCSIIGFDHIVYFS